VLFLEEEVERRRCPPVGAALVVAAAFSYQSVDDRHLQS